MPLNFNISPYNDDFDPTKHFYRILFRPSVAVQARELTQVQSILQQQVKNLGDSIYQHGSMVIPGQVAIDAKAHYVLLQPTYGTIGNTPIPVNMDLFNNQVIQGSVSGLRAQVVYTLPAMNGNSPTLYVKYMNTGTTGETVFTADEILTLLNSGNGLAQVASNSPTGLAISAQIDKGVYYVWGNFVEVEQQYFLLSPYTNIISTRVGLDIIESIVTPEQDPSLLDNAQGANNYAAPGSHRYRIDLILTSKSLDDTNTDANFIELVRLKESIIQKKIVADSYSVIEKELAQRMSDTNGDFAVRNFAIDVREHLDTSFVTMGLAQGASVQTSLLPPTIRLATSASAVDGAYNGMQLYLNNGSGAGQVFQIVNYVGSTKTATLDIDYKANEVADITSTYTINDATKINRGIYPPQPFGTGDKAKLAVGMESGRAYVDGYLVNTLTTTYLDVPKARESGQASHAVIPTPIGSFLLVKNLHNIPMAAQSASKDFLTIHFSNQKASGASIPGVHDLGSARVHAIEFYQGTNSATTDAVFKMFLFDINMNTGADISNVRSFYLSNDITHNNNGNTLDAYGDVCTVFGATNVNGTGLVKNALVTGPSSTGTETLVSYDPINNLIITEPNPTNGTQILNNGTFTIGTAPNQTTGTLSGRTQIFSTQASTLIYKMPQQMVGTIRSASNTVETSYYVRKMFEATSNSSGDYVFTTAADAPFASLNAKDYLACIVDGGDRGKFVDLVNVEFSGNPAMTSMTVNVPSGIGSTHGSTMKLMATVYRIGVGEKQKTLTSSTVTYPNPTARMSLQKADIFIIEKIIDSGDPGVDPINNSSAIDIKDRYLVDSGQRDYYYDVGAVFLRPSAPKPAGRVMIVFKYFAHSGTGDYFSVDSYKNQVDYAKIPVYSASNGIFYALRDCLDFRPRKSDLGYGFSETGASYSAPLSTSAVVTTDFQYYLSRIDKIYLDEYGRFNLINGIPSLVPQEPKDPIDGMMLYTLKLHPYTLNPTDLIIKPTKNPRYTMRDIGKLEARIANLEYYTNLNQLEQSTASMQITDTATGLNRYKNGFVTDNFTGHSVGNVFDPDYSCAIDTTNQIMRPCFVQISNDLVFNVNASSGYVNRNNILLLPYTETANIVQTFATDIINVNPFAIFQYHGDIVLNPPTDSWYSTVQLPALNVTDNSALDNYKFLNQWSQTDWGDWQTTWVGVPQTSESSFIVDQKSTNTSVTTANPGGGGLPASTTKLAAGDVANGQDAIFQYLIDQSGGQHWVYGGGGGGLGSDIVYVNGGAYSLGPEWEGTNWGEGQQASTIWVNVPGGGGGSTTTTTTTTTATVQTTVSSSQQIGQARSGSQSMVTASATSQKVNNALVSTDISQYIRSRRVQVIGKHFKPNTQLFPYFDSVSVASYCRPYSDPNLTPSMANPSWPVTAVTYGGDFSPQDNMSAGTSTSAGDTGVTVSVPLGALGSPIMTDAIGTCTIFFEIPCTAANEFKTGTRVFRLTDSPVNSNTADSYGDANYTAAGLLEQYQETITAIMTPTVLTRQVSEANVITQNLGATTTDSTTVAISTNTITDPGALSQVQVTLWQDPLAQSFLVKSNGGLYVTSIDVYFQTADEVVPIQMQIRNMVNGYPGQDVVPFSQKVLYPNNPILSATNAAGFIPVDVPPYSNQVVNISDNASVPTRFTFDCPVYLNDGVEYAFVLIANSVNYFIYSAKIGGTVIGTNNIVSTPPYLGNLFKSQNASTWVADPSQNLKFTINQAIFDPTKTGQVYFTNSSVQPDTLSTLPFQTVNGSNVVRIWHRNHMMPKGEYSNSVVTISNVPTGTSYGGLTADQLNGTHSIDNVDLKSYTITVPGSPATSTSRVGPDGVIATRNYQYDSICPIISTLSPSGTSVVFNAKTVSGKSVNTNPYALVQEPYIKDADWSPITVNTTSDYLIPRMIGSDINETTSIVGASAFDRKSFTMQAIMATTQANLSPEIDLGRTSVVLVNNLLDDPTFANYTDVDRDMGVQVPATGQTGSNYYMNFKSLVIVYTIAVTGGQFQVGETVSGAVSSAYGTVISWDSVSLVLGSVHGTFEATEAVTGTTSNAIGTVHSFEYVNTISNPNGGCDFSVFHAGLSLIIEGAPTNGYGFNNPVTILDVTSQQLTVIANPPFTDAIDQANVQLTQYVRYVAESGPSASTTSSRYITRQFNLSNPANSLQVYFAINRPPGAFVDCYYRILAANSTQSFGTIPWKLMSLNANVDNGVSTNPLQYKDYLYEANDLGSFTAFSIKLVMRGGNTAQVPKIQSFRGIALAT